MIAHGALFFTVPFGIQPFVKFAAIPGNDRIASACIQTCRQCLVFSIGHFKPICAIMSTGGLRVWRIHIEKCFWRIQTFNDLEGRLGFNGYATEPLNHLTQRIRIISPIHCRAGMSPKRSGAKTCLPFAIC